MKKDILSHIKHAYETAKDNLTSLVDTSINPYTNSRCSTLSPHALATVLAYTVVDFPSAQTRQWISMHAQGRNIMGIPSYFSKTSPFSFACFTVLETMCGVSLPPLLKKKMPSVDHIARLLDFPFSYDTSYTLPYHLACAALISFIRGKENHYIQNLYDLQQKDGSWTDDTTITALSALALQKTNMNPQYDYQNWLKREQLPNGAWAAVSGEVWEAAAALRTGEANTPRLINTLIACIHPNYWWGFSRYSVPDTDDTAVACCALAPYNPLITHRACENLLSTQHESGGWGAFPRITGVVPFETVIKGAETTSNDCTCHVLEALEQNNKKSKAFNQGIGYLLENQEKDGSWKPRWWRSPVYSTADIALFLDRNGYREPALTAVHWLEKTLDNPLTTVECALIMKTCSEFPRYTDVLHKAVSTFLEQSTELLTPTYDGAHFVGLIDYAVYRLSIIVSSLRAVLKSL